MQMKDQYLRKLAKLLMQFVNNNDIDNCANLFPETKIYYKGVHKDDLADSIRVDIVNLLLSEWMVLLKGEQTCKDKYGTC